MILGLFVKPIFLRGLGGTCPLGPTGSAPDIMLHNYMFIIMLNMFFYVSNCV